MATPRFRRLVRLALLALGLSRPLPTPAADTPIHQHPANPRYFEWRGRAVALITAAEHYGAVLNLDFDYRRYLAQLERDGLNYTRIFAGTYVEPPGAFGIAHNTLAPAAGRFLAPWARSDQPGYAGGGNRFDLERIAPEYLARLKDFLAEAGRHGVLVEYTLFCSTYGDAQWALSPFHPSNNVNGITLTDWRRLNTLDNGNVLPFQERFVRQLVRELNGFDNLFFELQNEPWADHHTLGDVLNPYLTDRRSFPNAVEITTPEAIAWQTRVAQTIATEESRLPQRHLLAQNVANFRLALRSEDLSPSVALANFHYGYREAVIWNLGLRRILGCDETGFAGRTDAVYRQQAWTFLMSGGGLFNHLDYSFSVGHEDGSDADNNAPGGGSRDLRRQLRVLSQFLQSFDLVDLHPDFTFARNSEGMVARALSAPGRQHAVYLRGRGPARLECELGRGRWTAEWINVLTGAVEKQESLRGGVVHLEGPPRDEIALRLLRK